MTVLTKPSFVIKKADATRSPLVLENGDNDGEEKVDIIYPPPEPSAPMHYKRRSTGALFCLSLLSLLVAIAGVSCGLMLYRQYLRSYTGVRRYSGFCSIPIVDQQNYGYRSDMLRSDDQLIEPNYHRVVPLRWSSEPDVQVFSVDGDEEVAESVANALREEFDVGSRFETIRVFDNGRTVSFIHDFDDNITGIVDTDRCFMMDLDPSIVLAPEMLVFGMENGDDFDVTRVRSTLRAVLPALEELAKTAKVLAERCMEKPTYKLQQEKGTVIRKRSLDAPSHDYIQFAGKHVQEIEISNLADLLQAEQNAKQA